MAPPMATSEQQAIWRAMCALSKAQGSFELRLIGAIVSGTEGARHAVYRYLDFLIRERIIEVVGVRPNAVRSGTYRVINYGEAPPVRNIPIGTVMRQQAVWTALRNLRAASSWEVTCTASTEIMTVSIETAENYLRGLREAGYLHARRPDHFQLLASHNTGPRAPIIHRATRRCFDLNLMRAVNVNRLRVARPS